MGAKNHRSVAFSRCTQLLSVLIVSAPRIYVYVLMNVISGHAFELMVLEKKSGNVKRNNEERGE